MQTHTFTILDTTLRTDSTVSAAQRKQILDAARGEPSPTPDDNGQPPRIYSRAEAAKLVGDKTPRYIDQLCKRGLLKKFTPKGNRRAIGISGESLHAFISGT